MLQLDGPSEAQRFYEQRYAEGYMDQWDGDRHARLREVLSEIDLPPGARVLDFGCGSGGLTSALRERWPEAEIHGADISENAVASARTRVANATFHVLNDGFVASYRGHFDLVFSHHVLEHVYDLERTIADLRTLTAIGGRMHHALPCGNEGGLSHWLCSQRRDGIDPARGGRYFFEEESHLRRLRSDQLHQHLAAHDFALADEVYGYHWFGVLRLLTEMPPTQWLPIVSPLRCRARSLPAVSALALLVAVVALLRAPTQVLVRARRRLHQVTRLKTRRLMQAGTLMLVALSLPAMLLVPVSLPCELVVRYRDEREWRRRRRARGGSEMFLTFRCVKTPVEESPGNSPGSEAGRECAALPPQRGCTAAPHPAMPLPAITAVEARPAPR